MEFMDILDGMGRRSGDATDDYAPARASAAFQHVLDNLSRATPTTPERSRAAYRANSGLPMPEVERRAEVHAPSLSLDPMDIAFELDLDAVQSADDLKTVRRLFARENHPDRVPSAEREHANARMTIANALIDEAAARFS